MKKFITCIECPIGCVLSVDIENCKVINVNGNQCPEGKEYAIVEAEGPERIFTSAVSAENLSIKMVPVRTDKPIPKSMIRCAMDRARMIRIKRQININDVIEENFLGLGVNLIATRDAPLSG